MLKSFKVAFFFSLTVFVAGLLSCDADGRNQVNNCVGIDAEGNVIKVYCPDTSERDCKEYQSVKKDSLDWSFSKGEVCQIPTPPKPNQ